MTLFFRLPKALIEKNVLDSTALSAMQNIISNVCFDNKGGP